jgi:hypothetical protein
MRAICKDGLSGFSRSNQEGQATAERRIRVVPCTHGRDAGPLRQRHAHACNACRCHEQPAVLFCPTPQGKTKSSFFGLEQQPRQLHPRAKRASLTLRRFVIKGSGHAVRRGGHDDIVRVEVVLQALAFDDILTVFRS